MSIQVVEELCVGCGQWGLACPKRQYELGTSPKVDEEACTQYRICQGFCSVKGVDVFRRAQIIKMKDMSAVNIPEESL